MSVVFSAAWRRFAVIGAACWLPACRTANSVAESEVKVTNGVETAAFPAVVLVANAAQGSVCTGTFVSDSTLVTAAHCLDSTPTGGLSVGDRAAVKVFVQGDVGPPAALRATDLAVVVFPPGSAPAVLALAAAAPRVGTAVTLVGFGELVAGDVGGVGVKRSGTNVVAGVGSGFLHLVGAVAPGPGLSPGTDAATGGGDSGGPLIFGGAVAGVVTGGGVHADQRKHTFYVDLTSEASCSLYARAVSGGAAIPGTAAVCARATSGAGAVP